MDTTRQVPRPGQRQLRPGEAAIGLSMIAACAIWGILTSGLLLSDPVQQVTLFGCWIVAGILTFVAREAVLARIERVALVDRPRELA